MFTPEKMIHIQMVFPKRDLDSIAETIIRNGNLHFVDPGEIEPWAKDLPQYLAEEEPDAVRIRRERIENLLRALQIKPQWEGIQPLEDSWEILDEKIKNIETEFEKIRVEKESKLKELSRIEKLKMLLGEIPTLGFPIESKEAYSYLYIEIGRVLEKHLDILKDHLSSVLHFLMPLGTVKDKALILVVGLKKDKEKIQSALTEVRFEAIEWGKGEYAISFEEMVQLDKKWISLRNEIETLEAKLAEIAKKETHFLCSALFRLRKERLSYRIRKYFRKTDHTFFLSGWIPESEKTHFIQLLQETTEKRCVIQSVPAESMEQVRKGHLQVPVKLKNPWFFKPFEMLTTLYGTPTYRSVDPTPLVGLSFLVMFGIMFGDVGHGLVLALVGAILWLKIKKQAIKDMGRLIFFAGCSSILFGFLFGSIFGYEDTLPHLWFKPVDSIPRFLRTMILFGVGMVSLSVVLSTINKFRKGQPWTAIFHRAGIVGLIAYWCGVALVLQGTLGGSTGPQRGSTNWLGLVLLGCLGFIFFQEPIVRFLQGKRSLYHEPGVAGILSGLMEGVVEILETFLGFLTNTVSFVRVAAFGLAHAGLFMAVFSIADLTQNIGHGTVSFIIEIFGNIGIILLEGLVASIQAIRLEFYEFFNRCFEHGDMPYRPVQTELQEL